MTIELTEELTEQMVYTRGACDEHPHPAAQHTLPRRRNPFGSQGCELVNPTVTLFQNVKLQSFSHTNA